MFRHNAKQILNDAFSCNFTTGAQTGTRTGPDKLNVKSIHIYRGFMTLQANLSVIGCHLTWQFEQGIRANPAPGRTGWMMAYQKLFGCLAV